MKWHGTNLHDCILAHTFKWVKNEDRGTEHCLHWIASNACIHPYITDIKYQWLLNPLVLFCCSPHRLELFLPLSFFQWRLLVRLSFMFYVDARTDANVHTRTQYTGARTHAATVTLSCAQRGNCRDQLLRTKQLLFLLFCLVTHALTRTHSHTQKSKTDV